MVDLKEQCFIVPGEQQDMFNSNPSRSSSTNQAGSEPIKSCTGCHTTTTPLWRGGPAGPKTLCNACGIKYHKKRRALLGMESGKTEKPKAKKKKLMRSSSSSASTSCSNGSDEEEKSPIRVPLKIKMVLKKFHGGGADQFLSRKLGEEEQAAILLMALSCGSVYA